MTLTINFRRVAYMCGWIALMVAASLLLPLGPALYYQDGSAVCFLWSAGLSGFLGLALIWAGRGEAGQEIRGRDGLAVVGISWMMIGLLGTTPYLIGGAIPNFWDALFESFSGFSTTGASILADIEALPKGVLFWRALTHWLGGMGIIVLMLAVLPFLGLGGMQMFKNEVPGPAVDKLRPRVAETAKYLWSIYVGLTALLAVLLMAGGLDWYEALCHTFSTMATGGFSTKNASLGHYASGYVEVVVTVFMIICSLNFALTYQALTGNWRAMVKNAEFRAYLIIIALAGLLVAWPLIRLEVYDPLTSLRHSFFQVVSIISTTGFGTADWERWPHFSQGVMLILFFIGGCSGSTAGGVKCVRWILLFKGVHRALRRHIHPRAVLPIRLGGKVVPEEMFAGVWAFFFLYILVLTISTLALAALDIDILTAFTAAASALGNVGPGLGEVGPAENYSQLPGLAKGILSMCMFLGRLEFFSLLILLIPDFWRK